jgi:uncharacterized protein (TIRG00374 family)
MFRQLRTILIVCVTGGLLAFFLWNIDLDLVLLEIRNARLSYLAILLVTTALAYFVRALRWQIILIPIGRTHFITALRTTIIGFAASALLPARPGEVLRPYLLAREEGVSASSAFATVLIERLLDFVTVLLLFGIFLMNFEPTGGVVAGRVLETIKIGGVLGALGASLALSFAFFITKHPESVERLVLKADKILSKRLATVLGRLLRTFVLGLGAARRPGILSLAMALSILHWLIVATGVWSTTEAFRLGLPFTGAFLLLSLMVVGLSVPTPAGVGGFHASFQIGCTLFYGVPNDQAVAAAIVLHAILFIPVAIIGSILMAQDGLNLFRMDAIVLSRSDD